MFSVGRYRTKEIFVRDDRRGVDVYEGPDAELVPDLMRALSHSLAVPTSDDPLVRGSMAHLNLVMIHPFRDANGRMARALQTMVLAQDQVVEPTFSSIEEWLGNNAQDYYGVLAATGRSHPLNDRIEDPVGEVQPPWQRVHRPSATSRHTSVLHQAHSTRSTDRKPINASTSAAHRLSLHVVGNA